MQRLGDNSHLSHLGAPGVKCWCGKTHTPRKPVSLSAVELYDLVHRPSDSPVAAALRDASDRQWTQQ